MVNRIKYPYLVVSPETYKYIFTDICKSITVSNKIQQGKLSTLSLLVAYIDYARELISSDSTSKSSKESIIENKDAKYLKLLKNIFKSIECKDCVSEKNYKDLSMIYNLLSKISNNPDHDSKCFSKYMELREHSKTTIDFDLYSEKVENFRQLLIYGPSVMAQSNDSDYLHSERLAEYIYQNLTDEMLEDIDLEDIESLFDLKYARFKGNVRRLAVTVNKAYVDPLLDLHLYIFEYEGIAQNSRYISVLSIYYDNPAETYVAEFYEEPTPNPSLPYIFNLIGNKYGIEPAVIEAKYNDLELKFEKEEKKTC